MVKIDYQKLILNYLFKNRSATRTEMADQLKIRKNTVGIICNSLIKAGKILELKPYKRRNTKLAVNSRVFISVGIEHRVDVLKMILLDANLKRMHARSVPLEGIAGEERVKGIIEYIREMLQEHKTSAENIIGLGFSDFIPHDIGTGLKTKSIWMPGWGDINIKGMIEKELGLETTIMRCTDAFSLAEHAFGASRGVSTFIAVQLDRGIGLSVFKNGTYLKGSTDIFGEMGHTVYREDGEICKCGNRGCLETFAGTEAIINKIKENKERGVFFITENDQNSITLGTIIDNAWEGNKLALLVIHEATKAIGDTIANVVNVLGITRIVLYGELSKARELLTG
ncbi:MAG: ROK family protein, partial [Spirochaetota bacterium]